MTEQTDAPHEADPDDDPANDQAPETMKDVDHTHPDTDESFTETGVYDRGKNRRTNDGG